ncbi:head-tail connector protein [Sphingomonas profundi]|uniref:head-tail connector protein n=1 Tax=Alterirhizorhabdus profundi TaxID=2681549 RepID=UPI0012E7C5C2|nr:head-tail connector protein [Sphingomonas profundi]
MMAVSVEDAKAYLRIEGGDEDALIGRLIAAAGGYCEQFIGQVAVARDLTETVAATGDWRRLKAAPVRAITAVQGLPPAGMPFALPVASYAIDIDPAGDGWVRIDRAAGVSRAIVSVQAGIAADAAGLPEPLAQGMLRLVAHLYAHRDAADGEGPPAAVAALWRPWRRMRLR